MLQRFCFVLSSKATPRVSPGGQSNGYPSGARDHQSLSAKARPKNSLMPVPKALDKSF